MKRYHVTRKSGNVKTGPIATTTSTRDNCPTACPLYGNGCYSDGGPLNLHWHNVTEGREKPVGFGTLRPQTFAEHVRALRALDAPMIRLNQAGDLPGNREDLNAAQCLRLAGAAATGGRVAWTYTHYPLTTDNAAVIRAMASAGTVVNVSGNNVVDAVKKRRAHGLPTVAVVPRDFKSGRYGAHGRPAKSGERFVVCPAQTSDKITCEGCGAGSPLCHRADRDYIVAFRAHGSGARKAENV